MSRRLLPLCLALVVQFCSISISYGEAAKLTIAHWMFPRNAAFQESMQKAIDSFKATHPNVEVEMIVPGTNYETYIQGVATRYVGGVSPDVLGASLPTLQYFWLNNMVLDITDRVNNDKDFGKAMYYPWTWEGLVYNNRIFGIPREINHRQLFISNTLMSNAGVSMPRNEWNWSDFLTRARRTSLDTNGDGENELYGISPETILISPWLLHAWGGSFYTKDAKKVNLLSSQSVKALEDIVELEQVSRVMPTPAREKALGGLKNMQTNEKIAMVLGDIYYVPSKTYPWQYTMRLFPKVEERAVASFISGFAISRESKNPELAWDFLKHLMSAKVLSSSFLNYDFVTARRDVNALGIYPNASSDVRNQIMYGLNETTVNLHGELIAGPFDNFNIYSTEITKVRAGKMSVRQILDGIVPVLQGKLDEFHAQGAAKVK